MDKVKLARSRGFFPMDKDGFIINPTSKEKIKSHWIDIIADIIVEYRNAYKDKVHSIYLRGSVAQGLDIGTVSDLDMFALLYNENSNYIHWKSVSWIKQFQKRLFEKYQLQNKIDLGYSTYVPDVREMNLKIQMVLKTQSLCVWGQDIIPEIRKFKPGKEMILNLKWLESDLNETIEKLTATENTDDIKELCTSIMKIIIRAGYELVIVREAKFTNELYQCYQTFSTYYPDKEQLMKNALDLFLNPTENKAAIIQTIEELGFWIVRKAVSET
jgi:hypothetical protein